MNCVTAKCEHCYLKREEIPNTRVIKEVIIPYCELGHYATYPFIDRGQELTCKDYCNAEKEKKQWEQ